MRVSAISLLLLLPATALAANRGDVAVIAYTVQLGTAVPSGEIVHYDASARFVSRERRSGAGALATDADMNLYVDDGTSVEVRDPSGRVLRTFPLPFRAGAMLVDRGGNLYVSSVSTLAKLGPDGTLLRTWPIPIASRMDLAADQCTLVFASRQTFTLQRKNLCTDAPAEDLRERSTGVRVLPDGRILSLIGSQIRVLTMEGRLLQIVTLADGGANRMALAADDQSVWVLGNDLRRVRLSDGATLARASSPTGAFETSHEFAVYGERRAALAAAVAPEIPALAPLAAGFLAAVLAVLAARRV